MRQEGGYLRNENSDLPRDAGALRTPSGKDAGKVSPGPCRVSASRGPERCVRSHGEAGVRQEASTGADQQPWPPPAPGTKRTLAYVPVVVRRSPWAGSGWKALDAGKGTGQPGQDRSPREPVLRAGDEAASGA